MSSTSIVPSNQNNSNSVVQLDVTSTLQKLSKDKAEMQAKLQEHQRQVREIHNQLERTRVEEAALSNYKSETTKETPFSAPSTHKRKRNEPIPLAMKAQIVQKVLYEKSLTWEQAIDFFGVSRSSISRIRSEEINQTENPQEVTIKKKRGKESPLENAECLVFLLNSLEQNSQYTINDLVSLVKNQFNIDTSTSAVDRILQKMNVTWKNILWIPTSWNTEDALKKRAQYAAQFQDIAHRPKYYIDESGFHLHMNKSKGRALAGEPAKLSVAPKGKRISLVAALGSEGIAHYELINPLDQKKRGVNAEHFRKFILDLAPKLPLNSVIIMDNCKIHHAEILDNLWDMIKKTYGIDKVYLPPYSPFMNPIEYAFNDIKMEVQSSKLSNYGDLMTAIPQALKKITPEKAIAFYSKSLSYHPKVLLGLPFTGKPLNPDFEKAIQGESSNSQSNHNNQLVISVPQTSSQ